jgi:hypothetical protein
VPPRDAKSQPRKFVSDAFDKDVDDNSMIRYDPMLRTDPAPRGATTTSSRAQAIAAALAANFATDLQPGAPQVALRHVILGVEEQASRPFFGWVLVWSGSRPDIKGPPGPGRSDGGDQGLGLECLFVMVVDATTLEPRIALQLCRPRPES